MHDLAIVGGGPVGSYLASLCSERMNVIVLEEDDVAGKKACSGLVSPRFMNMLPDIVRKSVVKHTLKGAKISFMGTELQFRKSSTAAYVVDRDLMDKKLSEYASSRGVDVRFNEKVIKLDSTSDGVKIKTAKHNFESKIVAGCDGARSIVARHMGAKPGELLNGLIIYQNKEDYSDSVEMWFDKSLVKDGFFWKIPRGDSVEYGCIGYKLSFAILEKFFNINPSSISKRSAAPIPIGLSKTVEGRMILLGDAASQTKPWSGGGLAYAFLAAKPASESIATALRTGDITKLSVYEKEWKNILLNDINAGLMVREIYKDLDLSAITSLMDRAESLKKENDRIDFDFPFSSAFGRL